MVRGIKKAKKGVSIANIRATIKYFARTDSACNIQSPFVPKMMSFIKCNILTNEDCKCIFSLYKDWS